MPYYVCKGAKLKCSMGSDQSDLEVVHLEKPVRVCGKFKASIMDHKPLMNIKPFGQCKSLANPVVASATAANYGRLQEMPCIPNTQSPWVNGKMNVFVKGNPALLDCSKCMCLWAGVIEITDPGQKLMSCGSSGLGSQDMGATAGAQNVAATPDNGLALQGAGMDWGLANNALLFQGTPASGSEVSQCAVASVASTEKLLVKKVEGATDATVGERVAYWVTQYNKEASKEDKSKIRWSMKVNGKIKNLENEKGDFIVLEMKKDWASNEISVIAFFDEFKEDAFQKTKVKRLLIKSVEGKSQASQGENAEYKIGNYSMDEKLFNTNDRVLSKADGSRIRWAIKVGDGGIDELVDQYGEKLRGERIRVRMRSEWLNKKILVMACMEGFNLDVSKETRVVTGASPARTGNTYKKGASGNVVLEINIRLAGFWGLLPDRVFTDLTEKGVKQFQRDYMNMKEPTGEVDDATLKKIDEFSERYKFEFNQTKCSCASGKYEAKKDNPLCSGFGNGKSNEYPGMHRSLLFILKALLFYFEKTNSVYSLKCIYSGYRCWSDNNDGSRHKDGNRRNTTNHMGCALDLHFNKKGVYTDEVEDMENIRKDFFCKYMNAPLQGRNVAYNFGWLTDRIGLEPKEFIKGTLNGAKTWVHVDVREFNAEKYKKSEFFVKNEADINGK